MTERKNSNEVKVSTFQSLAELDATLEINSVERKMIVSAKVICWDSKKRGLIVIFGKQVRGFIPEDHVSIYPSKDKKGIPSEAAYIIRKTIIAEIIDYNNDKTEIILSRANVMQKRLQEIKLLDKVTACITTVREKDLFVDVGAGLLGRVDCIEISQCFVEDIRFFGYHEGCIIDLKVIDIQNDKINLSRKQLYPEYDISTINPGDTFEARVLADFRVPLATISSQYAYFLEVDNNPNIKGVLDSDIELDKGAIVKVIVNDITEKGLRLRLISI